MSLMIHSKPQPPNRRVHRTGFCVINEGGGVEDIVIDNENQKVIVKGKNVDPVKVLGRLQKKYSRNVELISPLPKPDDEDKKEVQKKQEPKMKIIVLKMYMHCEGCANDIKRTIGRMEGIMSVEPDMEKSLVVIKGLFDPPKLIEKITNKLGKKPLTVTDPRFDKLSAMIVKYFSLK
ncbi:hypothetical protein GH714_029793 [Hevea brasiliensis]|uniref:HMA domain-containing protein n=1 Tax=Hevea brasiliensis TaxID=3981 RepID=A0A6A6KV74_HEVBR|nr:hypothetical protein GH714_029793 [Hevea brasiliensis]